MTRMDKDAGDKDGRGCSEEDAMVELENVDMNGRGTGATMEGNS